MAASRSERERTVRRVTLATLGTNLTLSGVKIALGAVSANQALFADGIHSLSDAVTDGLVLFGARLWSAPPDEEHPHGHGRIEILLTLLIGVILGLVGLGLVLRAFDTFLGPVEPEHGGWVFGAALLSLLANEALYRWSVHEGRRVRAQILIANAWHHRSDGLSSLPVALSVLIRVVKPEWTFVDPLAALVVSAVILRAAWGIAADAVRQLVDAGAPARERARIRDIVLRQPDIHSMHALRTRHIGAGLQVDLHIQVDPELTVQRGHDIAGVAKASLLEEGPNVVDVLIHIEPDDGHAPRTGPAADHHST